MKIKGKWKNVIDQAMGRVKTPKVFTKISGIRARCLDENYEAGKGRFFIDGSSEAVAEVAEDPVVTVLEP